MIKNIYMRILRRPPQYTVLASLIWLAIPIFLLNMWVVQKGSVSKLIEAKRLYWIGACALLVLVTFRWLLKVRWRGFWALILMSGTMLGGNVYFLVTTKNYALAFYALFLLILAALYAAHLFRHMKEPYYDSGRYWFEGQPRFLPKLEAAIQSGETATPARLSRLGVEGCYAYMAGGTKVDKVDSIQLKLGDLELNCAVELVSESKDGMGRGLRFIRATADQDKDIRDFIDRVRSAGYVS